MKQLAPQTNLPTWKKHISADFPNHSGEQVTPTDKHVETSDVWMRNHLC